MDIPNNDTVRETKTSFIWVDENGILCSVSKENPPKLTPEENEEETRLFLEQFGGKKHCFLIDAKYTRPNTPEERKRAAEILNDIVKAMAIIVHNPLGRMVVNLFVGLQKPAYPLKIFKPSEEDKAKEWLKEHL